MLYYDIFPDLFRASLDRFTHSLDTLPPFNNACPHCGKHDQWVSHGYIYKACPGGHSQVAGKRIVCARRYGRTGCGRTRQLYLADIIPRRQYRLSVVIAFIRLLIDAAVVEQAYPDATGCATNDARHAWRWINDFFKRLPLWRTIISKPVDTIRTAQRSRLLNVLLPTLERLFNATDLPDIKSFQCHYQHAFF